MDDLNIIAKSLGVTGLFPLKGDASTRQYWRANEGIVMRDVGEGSGQRRAKFIDIAKRLRNASIKAPHIARHIEELGLILLEDFGGMDLSKSPSDHNYELSIKTMLKMQNTVVEGLPHYNLTVYQEEFSRLNRFYLAPLGIDDSTWQGITAPYFEELSAAASSFVHVDYHAENLMICEDDALGILDFQDARFGHPLYDLASLIDDVRLKVPNNRSELLKNMAFEKLNIKDADLWFHIISAQRLTKIIGIFARLTREGRDGYDELLPQCFRLLSKRLAHPELSKWNEWFLDTVPVYTPENLKILRGAR